jgi:hypothetical protein
MNYYTWINSWWIPSWMLLIRIKLCSIWRCPVCIECDNFYGNRNWERSGHKE